MPFAQFRVIQISGWKLVLGAALLIALFLALFILAAGILLLALPIAVIAGAFAYLFGKWDKPSGFPDGIIETEYREIEQKQLEPTDERTRR